MLHSIPSVPHKMLVAPASSVITKMPQTSPDVLGWRGGEGCKVIIGGELLL